MPEQNGHLKYFPLKLQRAIQYSKANGHYTLTWHHLVRNKTARWYLCFVTTSPATLGLPLLHRLLHSHWRRVAHSAQLQTHRPKWRNTAGRRMLGEFLSPCGCNLGTPVSVRWMAGPCSDASLCPHGRWDSACWLRAIGLHTQCGTDACRANACNNHSHLSVAQDILAQIL